MILPILAYGHSILGQRCSDLENTYPDLDKLISDMWETMYNANGCGLAAPQVGHPIRLFIVDSQSSFENLDEKERPLYYPEHAGIVETFINAEIIERSNELWADEEGCLSIPGLTCKVKRNWSITIEYQNRNFERLVRRFTGATARMIQHEYDHTEGILYLNRLTPLTKKLMKSRLQKVLKGRVSVDYPMKFIR